MSVPVRTTGGFEAGTSKPLFDIRANDWHPAFGERFYAPTSNSQRFLADHVDATSDPVLNALLNWERVFTITPYFLFQTPNSPSLPDLGAITVVYRSNYEVPIGR